MHTINGQWDMPVTSTQATPRSHRRQQQNNRLTSYGVCVCVVVVIYIAGVAVAEPFNGRTLSGLVKERHRHVVDKFGPSDQGFHKSLINNRYLAWVAWCAPVKRGDTRHRSHPGGDLQWIGPIV